MNLPDIRDSTLLGASSVEANPIKAHIGLEIRGIDLREATPEIAEKLALWLVTHSVLVIRNQQLSQKEHVEFSQLFGNLETYPPRHSYVEDPEHVPDPWAVHIFPVSNKSALGYKGVGLYWHTDGYFHEEPTALSIMRSVQLPTTGGDTLFANMRRGYTTLPEDVRKRIENRFATSRPSPDMQRSSGLFGGISTLGVRHPLVRRHPVTGEDVLYVNLRNMAAIDGLTEAELVELLELFKNHIDDSDFSYRHRWNEGDVVIWDNASAVHLATVPDPGTVRHMERTALEGYEYFRGEFWQRIRHRFKTQS